MDAGHVSIPIGELCRFSVNFPLAHILLKNPQGLNLSVAWDNYDDAITSKVISWVYTNVGLVYS